MQRPRLAHRDVLKAAAIGVVTALLLSAVTVPAFRFHLSPMPLPPSLAFARLLLGPETPLAVGLAFHVAYVTGWSVVYVWLFRPRLTLLNALWLGLFLWAVLLVVFFPLFGWGAFGLAVGVKLVPASLVPHLLFALLLWGLCRLAFARTAPAGGPPPARRGDFPI